MDYDMYGHKTHEVLSLVLRETGTYNQAFRRPWEMHMDNSTQRSLINLIGGSTAIQPSTIGNVAATALRFATNYEAPAGIANGWDTRRYIFVLTLRFVSHLGITRYERITGYTESIDDVTAGLHFGASNAAYNPNAVFVINNAESIREVNYNSPNGRYSALQQGSSLQVLTDNNYTGAYGGDTTKLLRPEDVFAGIDELTITKHMAAVGKNGFIHYEPSSLTGLGAISKRNNSIASQHMTTTVNAFLQASRVGDTQDMDLAQQYSAAGGTARSGYPNDLSFIEWLTETKAGLDISTFTLAQLATFDPQVVEKIERIDLGAYKNSLHVAGQTAYWDRSDAETLFATALTTGVIGYMTQCELVSVQLQATNNTVGCVTIVQINKAQGIDPNADYTTHVEKFRTMVGEYLLNNISYGMQFTVECRCSAAGDCTTTISLNGNEAITYNTLTPADAIWSPVITKRQENLGELALQFDGLFSELGDVQSRRKPMMQYGQNDGFIGDADRFLIDPLI